MKVSVYSLKGVEFSGEASGVNVKTLNGEITVLNHHLPLITVLDKGLLKILKDGKVIEEKNINSGFLEMDEKNNLKLLVN